MAEQAKQKILVIEDEPTQRILAKEFLEAAGYVVRSSDDGKHGLNMATKTQPDLIILDLMLPSMDGYELCAALRAADATKHIPIILVTASKESDVIKRGLAAGANDFVTKPVDWQFLADRVAFVINQEQEKEDIGRQVEERTEAEVAAIATEKSQLEQRLEDLQASEAEARALLGQAQEQMQAASSALERMQAEQAEQAAAVDQRVADVRDQLAAEHRQALEAQRAELEAAVSEAQQAAQQAEADDQSAIQAVEQEKARREALEAELAEVRAASEATLEALTTEHTEVLEKQAHDFEQRLEAERQQFEATLADAHARHAAEAAMAHDASQEAKHLVDQHADGATDGPSSPRVQAMWQIVGGECKRYQDGLDAIVDAAATLGNGNADPEQAAKIAKSADQLSRSAGKLAKLAAALSETADIVPVAFDMPEFVKAIADSVRPFADKKGVDIVVDVPETPMTMRADPHRLRFALTLMAIDALRSAEAGATVTLTGASVNTGGVRLSLSNMARNVAETTVTALNTYLDKPTQDTGVSGSDLALDVGVVTALARQHGGSITLSSQADQTVSIDIQLPYGCAERASPDVAPAKEVELEAAV
jgi:two-component system, OmpR family, alkaline phosphatase synthesis response regulator PhoP